MLVRFGCLKNYRVLLKEIKAIFHDELKQYYPQEEIDAFFYEIIEHYLGLERFVLVLQPNLTIIKEEEQPLFEALAQLKLEKPLQYVLGKAHFMDLELEVNEAVLIPRPETEELVHWILEDWQTKSSRDINILDIGTGSGCIAIALAKSLSNAKVYALDVSEKALEVAQRNAAKNGVAVDFVHGDILQTTKVKFEQKFDIIVSNPPYVRELEKNEIKKNVKDFEPHLALFVPDNNPLRFYKAILEFAKENLVDSGKMYFEINQYVAMETKALMDAHNFSEIELRKDIFDNYRMLKGNK
ncbi:MULTISPECIES: peptide chain release factor N(5)-glutamine methyltransferase [Flavobacteriaceae]|uniref:peptide chain release factor N(5)-glutamine methyltransferase n=1 Tax=Flavobacteriaceae TaxID=49546 RepID=UPI001FE3BFD1|nr:MULTISPECIES: peptide chain release factor N(5)-glutamine methyltransferase [Allomuricauda]